MGRHSLDADHGQVSRVGGRATKGQALARISVVETEEKLVVTLCQAGGQPQPVTVHNGRARPPGGGGKGSGHWFAVPLGYQAAGLVKKLDEHHLLKFGDGPAFLSDIPLPLNRSYRRTDVQLGGRLHERVDLTIELPKGWQPSVVPTAMPAVHGTWGKLEQSVEVREKQMRLRRNVSIMTDTITPDDFEGLRQAVNELKTSQSLLLVVGKAP